MSIACPKCGFDLEAGKPCRVCGYVPKTQPRNPQTAPGLPLQPSSQGGRPAARPPAIGRLSRTRRSPQGPVVILLSAVVGLCAVVGVFMLGDMHGASSDARAAEVAPEPSASSRPQNVPSDSASPANDPLPSEQPPASPPEPVSPPSEALAAEPPKEEAPYDITRRREEPPTSSRKAFLDWMEAHTGQKEKFLLQKWALAQSMLRFKSVTRRRVLEAILLTPREIFCRDARRAYEDAVLPIGYGQTISGPHMVARMTDYLDPQPQQKVLEIGTGSGYQSAVLSELSNHVYTIEIVKPLAVQTDAIYRAHEHRYPEYRNIHRRVADGYYGWPEEAPFQRIIVTCGIDHVPPELLRELAPEGIMVIPVGPPSGQTILRIMKHVAVDGSVTLDREDIFHGKKREIFVPFTSSQGGVHVREDGKEAR